MRICVALLKGGKAATTTCAHLLAGYAKDGLEVLGIDTDAQGTLLEWARVAGDDFPLVVTPPSARLHRDIERLDRGYDHIVIDTPNDPDRDKAIVGSAMKAADLVLIPIAPSPLEFDRLGTTIDLIDDARMGNDQLQAAVLLTRVRSVTRSSNEAVKVLADVADERELTVLDTQVPLREHIAQSFGDAAPASEYVEVIRELERRFTKETS